ncbi:YhgE/Pip domain-containing protein [Cohnella xylanilytica]|uniref:YhgE/Pip domain-containing protein n=1 Tax=Cohnella xylanilytica TaxID=557555 RepID=A0A841TT99_9BACL|nr:YhgE/Pip domain-containing protein [Cohnella xylanilytica]MBB6691516.1 YhgE/Pip domain-containing protein [Cohnella xylanilytica]
MSAIAAIFARDLRRLATNPAAAVIVAGLIVLPSLYAWFNIGASWDPYAQTGSLPVAVVNQDAGTTLRGTPINAGKEIVTALKENPKIGWVFTDEADAMRGVERGGYYAAILIPAEFSARLATVLEDVPRQAEIDYYVNEKINAIAPKIASSGASGIVEEIGSRFVQTANGIIFKLFNQVGTELERNLPEIEKLRSLIFELEQRFPEIRSAANTAQQDAAKLNRIVGAAKGRIPEVARLAKEGTELAGKVGDVLKTSRTALQEMAPQLKQDLILLRQAAGAAADVTGLLRGAGSDAYDPQETRKAADAAAARLDTAAAVAGRIADVFRRLDSMAGGGRLSAPIAELGRIESGLKSQAALLRQIRAALDKGEAPAAALADRLDALSKETASRLDKLIGGFDSDVAPRVDEAIAKAASAVGDAQSVLSAAVKSLPDVQSLLSRASQALAVGTKELQAIRAELPAAEAKIKELAGRIRSFEKESSLRELISLLKTNAQRESEFFAAPVRLKENELFPIPGYGSAMSPFFTTLSLWVGALLLVSLLSAEVHEPGTSYASYEVYFGRLFTFVAISLLQSLLVTLGDIYILRAYVLEKGWFVLFGLLLSTVFMLMVYTLVSVFGNVGKAMAIVLLVLQLAGAGGTFPIQLTPPFFQAIHPFLPFTYGIGMMREAVGGILWDVVRGDFLRLLVFAWGALVVGLALKGTINRVAAGFVAKAKSSRLIH